MPSDGGRYGGVFPPGWDCSSFAAWSRARQASVRIMTLRVCVGMQLLPSNRPWPEPLVSRNHRLINQPLSPPPRAGVACNRRPDRSVAVPHTHSTRSTAPARGGWSAGSPAYRRAGARPTVACASRRRTTGATVSAGPTTNGRRTHSRTTDRHPYPPDGTDCGPVGRCRYHVSPARAGSAFRHICVH